MVVAGEAAAPLNKGSGDVEAGMQGLSWAEKAQQVPHQAQQVLISWIFILASITLFLDFVGLQVLQRCQPVVPTASCSSFETYIAGLDNWFGTISCIWWLTGFAVLQHWLIRIGATAGGKLGCFLKLVASVFFNLQPMTGVAGTRAGAGLWWSNVTGILFFHVGNLVSCADFYLYPPPGSNKQGGWLEFGNLPITGMWIYQLATWFLVAGNLLSCAWSGDFDAQWLPTTHWAVMMCQYVGSLLLLVGSFVYCAWCDGFRSLAMK